MPLIAEVQSMQAGLPAHRYVEPRRNLILMSSFALPDFSCGLIAGYQYGRWEDMQVFEAIMYQPRPRIHACLTAPCQIGARCGLQAEVVKAIFPLLPAA